MADVAMPNLPSELVEDILRRLPVKSLKRFRAVTKKWRSLIDSDRFVKLHLRHSLASLSNRHLIAGGVGVCTVALDSLDKANYFQPHSVSKVAKRLRNKIAGFSTHLMKRIQKRLSVGSHSSCSRRSASGVWISCPTSPPLKSTASRWVEDQTFWTSCVTVSISQRDLLVL
ncbi:hypothetical protein ACP275_08G138500 [Erythranthe tilingii]